MHNMFITFEGGEGTGKTTIITRLLKELSEMGFDVIASREPGGSDIAEQIRNVILNCDNVKMDFMTEALLYAASRSQHLKEVIIPALNDGKVVLCDRYLDSSLAYQGYARGLGIERVYEINNYAVDGLLPVLTIFIDLDPRVGLKRIKDNSRNTDRLDVEGLSFHDKVREGYLKVSKMYPQRIVTVDGNKSKEELYSEIKKLVIERLGR